MRLAVLGFGLIGGSVARALAARDPGTWQVAAWSRTAGSVAAARSEGIVDVAASDPFAAIDGADVVLLAASPLANLSLVDRVGPRVAALRTTLTDVTSTQRAIAARAADVPGLRFVGGHPMAGREQRGYQAADEALFVDRPWLVLPGLFATPDDVDRVERLARACGALPRRIDPATHDRLVAAISHLPLIASVALAEAVLDGPDWPAARALAAGGWRDSTRLARGDAEMAAGIVAGNADLLDAYLGRLEVSLAAWRAALRERSGMGASALRDRFDRVRAALEDEDTADEGGPT